MDSHFALRSSVSCSVVLTTQYRWFVMLFTHLARTVWCFLIATAASFFFRSMDIKSSMHTYKQNDNRWIRDLIQWITNRKFFFIISFQCKKLEKKKFLTHDSANHVTKPLNIIFIPLNITSVYVFKRRPVSIIDYVFTPFLLEVNSRQQVVLATIIVYIYIYYCFMSYFYWCAMYHRSGWHHSILSSCTLVSECGDLLLSWRWEY